ncbi:MAG: hypothetical protein QOJ54_296 [Aliidongia sp.]|jgi:uncharacterized small protein (DUF1192 family)|nr:hypothetical protein [Aliidongia sp.]
MAREDDDAPQHRKLPPKDLTPLSVVELNDYIAALEAEATRARAAIAAKQSHRSGADSLFKR